MQSKVEYFVRELRDLTEQQNSLKAWFMFNDNPEYEKGYLAALRKVMDLIAIYKLEDKDEDVS